MELAPVARAALLTLAAGNAAALGVPNVARTPGELLSGPNAPEAGRTPVIAWHGDMLVTFPEAPGSPPGDYQVRAWDISDPSSPVVTQILGPTRHGFMAHGFIKQGPILNSGYTFVVDAAGRVSEAPDPNFRRLGWTHGGMSVPWGVTNYWSYGDTSEPAELYLDASWNDEPYAVFDPVGETGVIGHPFSFGRYLYYASDQSRTGIASYDVTDPSHPVLLDVLTEGSVGGYWPDPVGINGRLYFFFPHDNPEGGFHVVDATDPTDLRLVADVPLDGNLNYAQFQDEYAFSERYKIDMRTFEVVLALDEAASGRPGDPIDTSQFSLPIGNLVVTGGLYTGGNCQVPGVASNHCGTGMSIWAHQAEPDTRGPFVGYHAPADGETGYPVTHPIQVLIHETLKSETINASTVRLMPIVAGTPGPQVACEYWFASNDILSIVPTSPLAPDTTYRVELVAGGIRDAVGNGMQPYTFEFSTGSTLAGDAPPVITSLTVSERPVTPGSPVTITATAADPEGTALEYRFDFGDGTTPGTWSATNEVTHTYTDVGHYQATVQVRDAAARVATETTGVTALTSFVPANGTHSSHFALGPEGETLWVVNPDNDTVTVLERSAGTPLAEYRVCADPRSVAFDAAGRAWIPCHDADAIAVMARSGRRVATISTGYGSAPFAVAMANSGTQALISLYGEGTLSLIDTATLAESDRLPLGPTPRAIAVTDTGDRALVTRFVSPEMHGEVWDVALTGNALALSRTITLAHQWGTDERFDGRGVPNYLAGIAIAPDGARAYVTAKKDNVTRGLYLSGSDLDQDNTVRAMLAQIDLATGAERMDLRRDLDNSEQPNAIAFSPLGDYAFVSLQGSNAVLVVDTLKIDAGFSGVSSVVSRVGVGAAPQALLYDEDGEAPRLWVHDFLDRTATRLDLSPLLGEGAASFPQTAVALVSDESLPAQVLAGKRLFYHAADPRMSGEGYMACATCHIDGGHDGRTFDFTGRGEGIRNTPTLRGRAGMGHGLVHWSANFDEIQDFEHDIRGPFGGEGFLSDADFAAASHPLGAPKAGRDPDLDALAAYVASLGPDTIPKSPHRAPDGALTAAAVRGLAEFDALGCADCHTGPERVAQTTTALDLRDVGTVGSRSGQRLGGPLAGIDVPTLKGLHATAPYLHTGAAASLADVFGATRAFVTQAEDGSFAGSHDVRDGEHWSIADLAVVRGGEFVHLGSTGSVTVTVDAPAAGPAMLTVRYHANYRDAEATLTVGGEASPVTLPRTLAGDWRYRAWSTVDLPVLLAAGANEVTLRLDDGGGFAVDEFAVTSAADVPASNGHAAALALPPARLADLVAFLEQLDGRPDAGMDLALTGPADGTALGGRFVLAGSTGSGGSVAYALDGGVFTPMGAGTDFEEDIDTRGLAEGWHTVTVRLTDGASGVTLERQLQFYRDPMSDRDGDGLSDDDEAFAGTNPDATDSDADGVDDPVELAAGSDPLDPRSVPGTPSERVPLPWPALLVLALLVGGMRPRPIR